MALTKWKQIDGDLSGSRVLTGSLQLTGSLGIIENLTPSNNSNRLRVTPFYTKPSGTETGIYFHGTRTGSYDNSVFTYHFANDLVVDVTGSSFASSDHINFFNRLSVNNKSRYDDLYGLYNLVRVTGDSHTGDQAIPLWNQFQITGTGNITGDEVYVNISSANIDNPNSTVGIIRGLQLWNSLTAGSASAYYGIDFQQTVNSNYHISGDYALIYSNETSVPTVGGSTYNIYLPAAMDSYLGGKLQVAQSITGSDVKIDDWGSVSASLATLSSSVTPTPTFQQVTDQGATTTNDVVISGSLNVTEILTAREFHTEYVSSSIIYESGSTKFGDTSDDVHQFTGSIYGTNQIWVDQYRFNNRDSDYIYSVSDGQFGFRTVEGLSWFMSRTEFGAYRTDGPSLMRAAATSTVPTLVPNGWADENTGIGWNGADSMAFIAGGTNVMNVSGSKVGIGTTSPQAELHVEGDISGSGNITITRSDSGNAVFTLNTDRAFGRPFTITNNGVDPVINAQDILRIQADDGAAEIKLDASGQDYISFITSNSEAVRINSARNVGIGTTSPTEKLTVEGNISGSGTINVASSITGSDVKIDDWGSISASLASISNISTGLGIVDLDDSNDITVSIDTGSAHFINGVLKSGVFRQTGSYYNTTNFLQITGSLTVESNDEIPFEITSGSKRRFAVQHDGVLSLVTQSTTPTAIVGGLYLDNSYNIFIGQE